MIARNEYTKNELKNPIDCSLFYLALKKKTVLQGLWRMAAWNREQGATLRFLANNFDDPKWRTAALKNAYALMSKRRFGTEAPLSPLIFIVRLTPPRRIRGRLLPPRGPPARRCQRLPQPAQGPAAGHRGRARLRGRLGPRAPPAARGGGAHDCRAGGQPLAGVVGILDAAPEGYVGSRVDCEFFLSPPLLRLPSLLTQET